ncbi:hypothetical protein SAMN06272735_8804 [Streptomyces sp. TLI_55]|uniref:hypothetical protein n=1 Tax=Streptomyces sp. TLI_55 TaxID=1938861 RepID=UPI000BDD0BD8|nr:hypothetical protein [Streptomyces sp. TLI_55]SNX88360.1 hypothetical protein SAMN06272735_8804 [Streptomyces sp. TLI_55]
MTDRSRSTLRPALTAVAALFAVFAVAGGLPLARRAPEIVSELIFGGSSYNPALIQLLLLLVGSAVVAAVVRPGLRTRRDAGQDEAGER